MSSPRPSGSQGFAWKSFNNCLSTCSETGSLRMLLVLNTPEVVPTTCMSAEVSLPSHKPGAPRRIGFGLLSTKSTQHNFTKLAKCRSIALAPTTFKRSQAIGSNCKVVQQELRMFHKPSENRRSDRASVPYRSARSCRSVLTCA